MKRSKPNQQKSRKSFSKQANKTHKINKAPANAFLKRGGIRL